MNTYMVTFLLLLFEVNLNFGHTLSKIKLNNEAETYEVKEDQSALHITHPKEEATKLREIIYYHIIEKPYNGRSKDSHDKIKPEFEKRFFTNSHSGIQFEKKDCDDDDEDERTSQELYDDSSNSSEITDDSYSSESNQENDNERSSDKNDLSKDKINDEHKSSSNRHGDSDPMKKNDKSDADDKDKSQIDVDSIQIDIRFSDFINTSEEGVAKVENTATYVTAEPETENEAISETPQSRRKRDINYTITEKEKSSKTGEGLNHVDGKTLKREGGTYGMRLTGNRGVVWNDVKPTHIEYHVGEPEAQTTSKPDVLVAEDITTTESVKETAVIQNIDEDNQGAEVGNHDQEEFIDTFAEIENILDKLIDKIDKADESENTQENQKDGDSEKSSDKYNHNGNNDSSLDPKEIEKTFIEILKVYKELTGDGTRNPAITDVNDATKSADDADIEEKVSERSFLRTPKEDDAANGNPDKLGTKFAPKRNDKDKETSNKDNDSKQQQFVKELLKNKYFWAWLKDASAAFLEIFMKKLDAVIKTEVGKQIEQYFQEHKNENCKQDKIDQNNAVQEPIQTSNVTDENVKGNTTDTPYSTYHYGLASNDTVAESINKSNQTSSEISTKKHKDKPSGDKNAESAVKIEAQNIFGSSVGSDKVTNIFIYNMNKAFDLEDIKPMNNGTNGVFVFGLDDKKPEQEKDDAFDKDTIHEVETVIPDLSSEHNKTVDKVYTNVNQTSEAKPEAEEHHQNFEKDKIEDQEHDKDNVTLNSQSTDKNDVIPNDQTYTESNHDDKTSTEINKEGSSSEKSQAIKDNKETDVPTEKEEAKTDLNDPENYKSKETAEDE